MTETLRDSVNWALKWIPAPVKTGAKEVERVVVREVTEVMAPSGRLFIRVAGVSGLLAVGLGAYGAHVLKPGTAQEHLKLVFETGNRYHFFHTLALLAVPLTNRPNLTGSLFCLGMLLFSGSCYGFALTQNETIRRVTPYGGMLLMAAWASMIF